uniref:Inositol polyphosphate-5-phosphatase Ja n=1 Tax=Cyprinus carpio TaxID=7962 RepID=A0A8C1IGG5_CYPCA
GEGRESVGLRLHPIIFNAVCFQIYVKSILCFIPFRVQIVTWNIGSGIPPDDITSLFGPGVENGSTDMIVVGLQEVNSMINKRLKDALFTDQWSELCLDTLSHFGYVLVASRRMQGVFLLVFSKFCHLPFLRGVQTQSTRTGLGGYWVRGISERMIQRMENFESILQQQQFEGSMAVGVLDHDVVFWFGDLNFRIEGYDIHVVKSATEKDKLPLLWEKDQLNMVKKSESVVEGFMEGPLNFPPTYKFDVGTHTYDTRSVMLFYMSLPVNAGRAPPYRPITLHYSSHMGFTLSDHKPVSALFCLHFPFKVNVPLVTLEVEKEWTKFSDATVKLTVMFPEEDVPRDPGEYILGYYSNTTNSIVGVKEPFQVHTALTATF